MDTGMALVDCGIRLMQLCRRIQDNVRHLKAEDLLHIMCRAIWNWIKSSRFGDELRVPARGWFGEVK